MPKDMSAFGGRVVQDLVSTMKYITHAVQEDGVEICCIDIKSLRH